MTRPPSGWPKTGPRAEAAGLAKFFLAAFGIPWLLFPLMYYLGILPGALLMMFAPSIGAIWAGHQERPDISLSAFKTALYALVWLGIAVAVTAPFQEPGYRLGEALAYIYGLTGMPESVAVEMARAGELENLIALLLAPAAVFINAFVAFGEEYGWRGYLTPLLARRMGWVKASIVTGVIWGLWHAPVILLGLNYIEKFWIPGVFLFLLFTTPASVVFTYAYLKHGVWGSSALHGALNAFAGIYFFFYLPKPVWLYNPAGIMGALAWIPLAVYAAMEMERRLGQRP